MARALACANAWSCTVKTRHMLSAASLVAALGLLVTGHSGGAGLLPGLTTMVETLVAARTGQQTNDGER